MSYAVYTTRGFILSSAPSGEASKTYSIYMEDFGLVRARAQGVRLIQSKLRYSLDEYMFCDLSLVRGKEFWRITGSQVIDASKSDDLVRARVLNLVRRLVHGEEKNEKLFEALVSLTSDDEVEETSILSHVLSALGYLDPASLESKSERERVNLINKALKETQL